MITQTNFNANTLKIKNLMLIYLIMVMVPFTRIVARHTSESAQSAAWVAPVIASLGFAVLILMLGFIVNQNKGKNLAEICRDTFGRVFGTAVNIIYAGWFFLLAAYYLRQFGERMATTVFFDTSSAAFVAVMLVCVGFALRYGPNVIIRTGSLFFYALATVFILSAIVMLPQMDFGNLLPVYSSQFMGIASAATDVLSALGYAVIMLVYFGDIKSDGFKKSMFISTGFNTVVGVLSVAVPIGIFSAPVVAEMIFPYFSAAKGIRIFDSIERVEAIIISFFILADFIIVAFTLMSAQKMLCHTVKSGITTPYYSMLLLGVFIVSLFLGDNSSELNAFSRNVIIPLNLIMGVAVPTLVFLICLIKRKKDKSQKT